MKPGFAVAALAACAVLVWTGTNSRAQPLTFPYFIADAPDGRGARAVQPGDRELALWALGAWERAAPSLRFEPARESDALVRLYWTEAGEGRYGEMQPLTVLGRRGGAVFIQADVSQLGEAIAARAGRDLLFRDSVVYLTCLHEFGHALGLAHTSDFRDIMYFFGYGGDVTEYFGRYRAQVRDRSDIARVSGLSAADIRRLGSVIR